jgi:hypothetical protein
MPPDLIAMFLLAGSLSAVTIATIMYVGFPRPETRFTLVETLLLVYAVLTLALAPLVWLPHPMSAMNCVAPWPLIRTPTVLCLR